VLRVGVDPTFPPFAVTGADGLGGIDIDLARALAAQMGVDVEFILFGYDGLYDALLSEQVDLLISALVIMPERTRDFAYSEPYFNAGEILVAPASAPIGEMGDMNGRALAVELGALGHLAALDWQKRLEALAVEPYPSAGEALDAVAGGAADAALVDAVSGRLYIREQPALHWLEPPVTVEPYAVVARAADERLLAEVDRHLAALDFNGELGRIMEKWLGP